MAAAAAPAAAAAAAACVLSLPPPPPSFSLPLSAAPPLRRGSLLMPGKSGAVSFIFFSKGLTLLPIRMSGVSAKHLRLRTPAAAAPVDAATSEAIIESAQKVMPAPADDGATSTVISVLLLTAFVGLSILTVGVIYIAVTDFLQKREREKFEKEEASKKKKGGKKVRTRSRAGPRGFGQKVAEIVDEDLDI